MLVILTAVEKVAINFNTPEQADIDSMTIAEANKYIEEGQFAPGSMLPKVQACIEYLEAYPKGKALITSLEHAAEGLNGETGTIITALGPRCDIVDLCKKRKGRLICLLKPVRRAGRSEAFPRSPSC